MRQYSVYILANRSRELYIGVTNNLELRVAQHRLGLQGYTARHQIRSLVYHESTGDVMAASRREKQIKVWKRAKKLALVESMNPEWRELLPELDGDRKDSSLRFAQGDKPGFAQGDKPGFAQGDKPGFAQGDKPGFAQGDE